MSGCCGDRGGPGRSFTAARRPRDYLPVVGRAPKLLQLEPQFLSTFREAHVLKMAARVERVKGERIALLN